MDYRLKNLSYSARLMLHECPRKFQLQRLQSEAVEREDQEKSITLSFGHIVGHGIQKTMEGLTPEKVMWEMFLMWEPDLLAENTKQVKSFWYGILAVQKFQALRAAGFLADYELVYYQDKPACELSFRITFPDGFKYRGFVDIVLKHRITGEVMVLELKTTSSATMNPATYKNSSQAVGYSVVLDVIEPSLSSYKVLYLVYKTKSLEYEQLWFDKSYLMRALWIRELLLDLEIIKMYEEAGVYPMYGESCYSFYRECQYMGLCTLSTDKLIEPAGEEKVKQFQIELTLDDLITSQLSKSVIHVEQIVEGEL